MEGPWNFRLEMSLDVEGSVSSSARAGTIRMLRAVHMMKAWLQRKVEPLTGHTCEGSVVSGQPEQTKQL